MALDQNLASEMIEKLPVGIYVVNPDNQIIYYNQEFSRIFETGVHPILPYFGTVVRCRYCKPNGATDVNEYRCTNCLVKKQHRETFDRQTSMPPQELVQEFTIGNKKEIKYLSIQTVYLSADRIMVLVRDLTKLAQNLMTAES